MDNGILINNNGFYITIEGNEGAGKGVLVDDLRRWFTEEKIKFYLTREPGGSVIGEQIRKILSDTKNKKMFPLTELLLFMANRAQNIREIIIPKKKKGLIVLSDRGLDSSTVYQGAARKIPKKIVKYLNNLTVGGCIPDLTIILLVNPEVGLERVQKDQKRNGKDRIEKEEINFHYSVYNGYKKLSKTHKRFVLINTTKKTPQQVFEEVKKILIQRKIVKIKGAR